MPWNLAAERLKRARQRAIAARQAWRIHRQHCRLCAQLANNRNQYCTEGWEIRVELHHAEKGLAAEKRPLPPQSEALF